MSAARAAARRRPGAGARAGAPRPLAGRRVVVSAGPTREHLDPVRYLSNESSGRLGFALARAAAVLGASVTLVAGPVALATPRGVRRVDVVSAREMLAACRRAFRGADGLVMAAAVADFRPRRRLSGKWRAKDGGARAARLELVANPDVLATLGRSKGARAVIGFALETGAGLRRARAKLARKNADFVVLNGPANLGGGRGSCTVIGRASEPLRIRERPKAELARAILAATLVPLLGPRRRA
jgi:phosphopantothenoylcysteine decarboxylase/phosphopantothenate--cysteine ligase